MAAVSPAYNEGNPAERFLFGKYNNKRTALREAFKFNSKLLKLASCKKPPQFPEAVYT